jgi:hypothetical protein
MFPAHLHRQVPVTAMGAEHCHRQRTPCSVGLWMMAGAGLFKVVAANLCSSMILWDGDGDGHRA